MHTDDSDDQLAEQARDGCIAALTELVDRYRPRLFAMALYRLGSYDDAQDVVATALMRICSRVGSLRAPERARAWMEQVLRNEIRQHCRRTSRDRGTVSLSNTEIPAPGDPSLVRIDVQLALRQLPRDHARAVALLYLGGCSTAEIARQLGRPEGTVRRWLCQGRRQLSIHLQCYDSGSHAMKAAIVHSDLDDDVTVTIAESLRAAGIRDLVTLDTIPELQWSGQRESVEWVLPAQWDGIDLFVVSEWIGGRSALELLPMLKLRDGPERSQVCVLVSAPVANRTLFAYWSAGADGCLPLPLDPAELQAIITRLTAGSAARPG